jgi:protein TonB
LVLSCLAVSTLALTRPVATTLQLLDQAPAGAEGVASAELALLEMAAPPAAEPPAATATAAEASLTPPLPELSMALPSTQAADLPTVDLAEVLTAEDVFEVPPAAPVEDLLKPETPRQVRTQDTPPARSTRPPSTPPSRSSASSSGAGSPSASSGGTAGGTGSGRGGSSQGYFPSPPYPAAARSRGMQGTVYLSITFGADGRVTNATVARSSGYSELDRAAADWVRRRWRGSSTQVGTYRQPVNFRLR